MDERVQLPYQPIRASDQILGWLTSSAWNFGGHNADVSPAKRLAKTGSDERQMFSQASLKGLHILCTYHTIVS